MFYIADNSIDFDLMNYLYKIGKQYFVLAAFTAVIFVFYGNTLLNGFVLDDRPVIQDNTYIQSLRYLPKVITGCIWEHAIGGCKGLSLHYRPLHNLSYLLTWQISSSPWAFHAVSLLQFLTAAYLIFWLVKLLTKKDFLAFLTALIWIINPINNEVANWNSAVPARLLVIFVSLALIYYLKYRAAPSRQKLFLVYLFYFLGIMSKETVVFITPALILAADFVIFKMRPVEFIRFPQARRYALFAIPLLLYLGLRTIAMGSFGGMSNVGSYVGGLSLYNRFYYFFWLFAEYFKALFYPYPLIFFHDVSLKPNIVSAEFIVSVLAFFAFLVLLYAVLKNGDRVLAFFMLWFFILILPFLVFYFVVSENYFAERYLFEPSVGFAFVVAYLLNFLWRRKRWPSGMGYSFFAGLPVKKVCKTATLLILVIIMIVSWVITFPRNKFWHDTVTFIEHDLQLNPNAASMRKYLADVFKDRGDYESAKAQYEEILRLSPDWIYIDQAYAGLGNYWHSKGDLDKAQEYYQKAVDASQDTGDYKSFSNLGAVLMEKQDYLRALSPLCKAVRLDPSAPEPQNNFGRAAAIIDGTRRENLVFLYMQLMRGGTSDISQISQAMQGGDGIFSAAEHTKINFKNTVCLYDYCAYIFSPQIGPEETLLPFLIMAEAFPNELVEVKKAVYQPDTGEIILNVDQKYQDRLITFMFPTCDNTYYAVQVAPQPAAFPSAEDITATSAELNP